jgi:hypothetical protein
MTEHPSGCEPFDRGAREWPELAHGNRCTEGSRLEIPVTGGHWPKRAIYRLSDRGCRLSDVLALQADGVFECEAVTGLLRNDAAPRSGP